jgi:hypothetical protein
MNRVVVLERSAMLLVSARKQRQSRKLSSGMVFGFLVRIAYMEESSGDATAKFVAR